MHELSVCLALVEQVERVAKARAGATVARVVIKLGPLSGIEPQLLRHSYPMAAAGTVAEHADLEIDSSEVLVHCTQCGSETSAAPNRLLCGDCGDFRTRVISGDEMILQSIEFRPADECRPLAATH